MPTALGTPQLESGRSRSSRTVPGGPPCGVAPNRRMTASGAVLGASCACSSAPTALRTRTRRYEFQPSTTGQQSKAGISTVLNHVEEGLSCSRTGRRGKFIHTKATVKALAKTGHIVKNAAAIVLAAEGSQSSVGSISAQG